MLICLGLWKIPEKITKEFAVFGQIVVVVITIGLIASIVEKLAKIVVIPGIDPIDEEINIAGGIAIQQKTRDYPRNSYRGYVGV